MDADKTFLKVQAAMQNMPLESILETAESLAPLIPAAGTPLLYVVKLLKMLIKWRPVANRLLVTGAETAALVQNARTGNGPIDRTVRDVCGKAGDMHDEANEMSDDEKAAAAERAEILAMLNQMIEIAAEDGELSDEEMGYLMDIAREAGVNETAVLAKVRMKCLQNKK